MIEPIPMRWKHCALVLILAVAARGQDTWKRWPEADRLFISAGPWTGADAAYSVDLGHDRVLWLFGDTFMGRVVDGKRVGVTMTRNTVGLQHGHDPSTARITFHVGATKDGVFPPPGGKGWIWPMDGVRTPRGLAVFLGHFEATSDGSAFGFRARGHALALVANPDAEPEHWRSTMAPLPFDGYGIALTPVGATLHIFGYRDETTGGVLRRSAVLARAPLASPERYDRWRFWDGARWVSDAKLAKPLWDECATELSVHGTGPGGGPPYVAVYTRNGLSPDILVRTAPALTGPWSEARVVYRCPEMKGPVFTYAAKAHRELVGGEIVATYVTNAGDLGTVVSDAALYRPLFLRGAVPSRR